jgi:hypothetical protein
VAHESARLLVDLLGVDQDLADVLVKMIADGADDQARLLVDQERAVLPLRGVLDLTP